MRKIICLFLGIMMVSLFIFVGCDSKKTINPPTITGVHQDGLDVYIDFEPLHNPYTPEFSLDGTNWYSPSNFENNSICIFTYRTETQLFVSMGDQLSVPVGEITVYIREVEGPDTLTTAASNGFKYTLLVPRIG